MAGDQLPDDVVRNHMTADPVTVLPGTRIADNSEFGFFGSWGRSRGPGSRRIGRD